jgi:beta-galactosidase
MGNKFRLNKKIFLLLAFVCLMLSASASASEKISLAGSWQFALDRTDKGIQENWFDQSLADKIMLPGALQTQGFGDEISTNTPWVLSLYDKNWFLREDYKEFAKQGNVKVPFLAQPPRHYLGAAWYNREIEIPANWQGKRVVLFLERPHWESAVWVDGKKIGSNLSLVAPHEYDLGALAAGKHKLSIRVDNRMLMNYRPDAHSVSDSLGMSWNGIVGKIELQATSNVWIDDTQVFTNFQAKTATVKIKIGNSTDKSGSGTITANGESFPVSWNETGGATEITLSFPNAQEWNEFHPNLNKISLQLNGETADDTREISFGFAEIKTDKNEFKLNGRTIYLRGTHHGGDFPLTGYPPTDVAYWRKIFQINKDWGINHIRFHSFCPPEAAFQAADEIGIYLQPEPGMWNEVSPGTQMEKMLYEETDRMIRAYGNHPSFLLLSPSNEPKGRWKEAFDKWIAYYREHDPRRLYDNGTGHTEREVPGLAEGTDFLVMQRIGQKMLRGNTAWFGKDYGASLEGINVPVASHELGQWVAYPNYDVIKKFTGYMRPSNYEIFRASAEKKGVLAKNKDFAYASGKYQLICYKEEIEANLRTPKMYGYQLLDLHDYLGQGTALVGILDAFWEEKGYATAKEFKRFNNETVPLARLYKRTFTSDEKFEVETEIAHFGEKPIENSVAYWKIVDKNGKVFAGGNLSEPSVVADGSNRSPQKSVNSTLNPPATAGGSDRTISIGKNIPLGKVTADLSKLPAPNEYKLVVGLKNTPFENDWNFWVYPSKTSDTEPKDVFITHSWDEAEAKLKTGAKVLYMPRKADLDWTSPPLDTVPVFWNRLMNPAWGRMLGLWIDKKHAALSNFPTDSFSDWQWMEIVKNARAINLDRLPKNLQPIVQPIDDWNRNYKLGMIFEAKVGKGKLLVSSADLENDLETRVVARALRKSILDYMASAKFNPQVSISAENFREILFPTRIMLRLGALTDVKEQVLAFDGDPNTFWLAGDQKKERQNQEFSVYFPKPVPFSGLVIMPRQNHRDHEGDIREYAVSISNDGKTWAEIKRGELVSTFDPQRILFGKTVNAKYLKLTSLSGFGSDKTTAIAELAIIYDGGKLSEDTKDLEYKRVKSASTDIDESINDEDKKPKKP